jgi:hypothetical protein
LCSLKRRLEKLFEKASTKGSLLIAIVQKPFGAIAMTMPGIYALNKLQVPLVLAKGVLVGAT